MVRFVTKPENSNYSDGFLPCKRIVDANYRCMTDVKNISYTRTNTVIQWKMHQRKLKKMQTTSMSVHISQCFQYRFARSKIDILLKISEWNSKRYI